MDGAQRQQKRHKTAQDAEGGGVKARGSPPPTTTTIPPASRASYLAQVY